MYFAAIYRRDQCVPIALISGETGKELLAKLQEACYNNQDTYFINTWRTGKDAEID